MNILFIANCESVHTVRFVNEFVKRGNNVIMLSATPYLGRTVEYTADIKHIEFLKLFTKIFNFLFKNKIKNFNPENSHPLHPFNFLIFFRMIYLFFFVNKIIKKVDFDAVFSINLTTNGVFASRIKRHVKKICCTLGCDLKLAKWYSVKEITNKRFVVKYVDRHIDYFISYNEVQILNFFKTKNLFSNLDKIRYINGLGVDVELFNPKYRNVELKKKYYGLDETSILAVCFRQPRPYFDFAIILLQLKKIITKYPNFYFAIGTGGLEFPALIKIVKENNMEKNILMMPNIQYKDLHLYISQGDIYIDPINISKFPETISMGISGSLLESMACGLIPVIGRRPGLESFFDAELQDLLIYNNLENDIYNYIENVIENKNNEILKQKLREIVHNKSNWYKTIELIETLFKIKTV